MTRPKPTRNSLYLALLCAGVVLAGGAAHSMANAKADKPDMPLSVTAAQQLFSDAPDGVDPMVTGPVSTAFKKRQHEAGCSKAEWPNVPATCYPG